MFPTFKFTFERGGSSVIRPVTGLKINHRCWANAGSSVLHPVTGLKINHRHWANAGQIAYMYASGHISECPDIMSTHSCVLRVRVRVDTRS